MKSLENISEDLQPVRHWLSRAIHRFGVWPVVVVFTLLAIMYSVLAGIVLDLAVKSAIVWIDIVYCIVIPALVAPMISYVSVRLVSDLEQAECQLRLLATKDSLTGLCTRRHFMELAEWAMEKMRRSKQPVSVLMMDADHFKQINDTLGHAVGDSVLTAIGGVSHSVCRSADLAGRYGGEEFIFLLPSTSLETALLVAERLRAAIEAEVAREAGLAQALTVSIGVATLADGNDSLSRLIEQADQALYEAKRGGRNCVRVAT